MLSIKADALHPYQTAAFYVLFLIVEKQTCICLEVEFIKESPVDGWIRYNPQNKMFTNLKRSV